MAPSNLEKAEAEQEALKDHIEFLETEFARHSTPATALTETEVDMYMRELDESRKLLGTVQNQIRLYAPKTLDMTPYVQEYRRLSQLAGRVFAGLHGIKMTFPQPPPTSTTTTASTTTSSTSASSAPPKQSIKLPPLELPKFSGNLQEWISFRDLFITAVHHSSLTNVEKLTQLKALLTGEAARQVRSLVLSDTNYDIAWKSLQDRYENNRELLFSILKRLTNQPVLTSSSATNIRSLIDTTKECVRSLEVLSIPTQHWDAILLFTVFSKLDPVSRELWEQSLPDTSIPSLSKIYDFLEQRARALAASNVPPPQRPPAKQQQQVQVRAHHATPSSCKLGCKEPHPLFRCQEFQQQPKSQRIETVKRFKLCINCFMDGHSSSNCRNNQNCKICHRRHHTMLHFESGKQDQDQSSKSSSKQPAPDVQSHHTTPTGLIRTGILATAIIHVMTDSGESKQRTLIDPGSTNTHITERAARMMNLPLHRCNIPMKGLSSASVGVAKYVTSFTFKSRFDPMATYSTTALVVKSISGNVPTEVLNKAQWPHLQGLQLADPEFHLPNATDILLGTDVSWGLLDNHRIEGGPGKPYAVKSSLGWLVAGPNITSSPVTIFNVLAELDFHVRRFWEQETLPEQPQLTAEEASCEAHFASTHKRDSLGRFTVCLPFKDGKPELGSSRQAAIRRFISLERRFNHHINIKDAEKLRKLSQQWEDYKEFMNEYESLGHMSLIPSDEIHTNSSTYYIPHHSVIKEASSTTKLRVVFDASAVSTNGTSLNECMLVGPQLQDNIWDIMLRFRTHRIVFTADIAKMYRQIRVAPEDCDYQRIVWRPHPSLPLKDYRLLTVTYGTSSAPYLAIKCLQQLAKDEESRFPQAAKAALRDFYVDDIASGCDTLEEGLELVQQLMDLCESGGFQLRKWTTNNTALINSIPENLRETNSLVELTEEHTIKTLGLYWNPSTDKYSFRLTLPPDMSGNNTKRTILSEIAKIYDPLGWLAPVIIVCKIFMQELWKVKHDWDDVLPVEIQNQWRNIRSSLSDIERIEIPRCVISSSSSKIILVGCADASTKALSALVYIICISESGASTTNLLTSKTKVAPLKHVTLPRLELNAALLLSELIHSTVNSLHLEFAEIRAFTDSSITLHWIKSNAAKWKLYVKRRVQNIQDNVPTARWFHIPGDRNPADCASRGISAADLIDHPLWWSGTSEFITTNDPVDLLSDEVSELEREIQVKSHHSQPQHFPALLIKYSSFIKTQRVVAYLLRFYNNCNHPKYHTPLQKGQLTVTEILNAQILILRLLQQHCYAEQLELLAKGGALPRNTGLLKLQPFISNDGLLRVGGRLRNAAISYDKKHPVLLPRGHFITTAIIRDIHIQNFHSGPSATLATLQQRYWITNGRDTVRAVIRKCVTCARQRSELMNQVMGDLPPHRINPARPFSKVGVDYAGPITIRPMVRSRVTLKCWIAIFVCFATKAVHIEVVSSLSTDCFLAAFRRFIARRGKPSDVYSDCGTNFVGADKVLREFFILSTQQAVQDECASQQINWHFNPPGAPHFGGLWEAGVKSIKYHLVRVMGSSLLTYEEIHTLTTQIEGILNSRPIIPTSTDPSDLGALTPGHFLIGTSITSVPEPNLVDHKENYLRRWQLLQQRQQLFWKRWSCEYLTRLQQRPKWMTPSPELQLGDMVIIKEERLPPLKWKLGRVIAVHPGKDNHVRVATVKTEYGEIKRPVVKLCLLPISNT